MRRRHRGTSAKLEHCEGVAADPPILARLLAGQAIPEPVVAVVAHPDDETVGFGSRLPLLTEALLVHLTPGAPRDGADARRAGFSDREGYAAARARELDAALRALDARPRRRQLGYTDGEVVFHQAELATELERLIDGAAFVLTHAYEGGHPDHDAAALAVQLAVARLESKGRTVPVRLEFAGYHQHRGERRTGGFWPDPRHPGVSVRLEGPALEAKRAAVAAHRSQAAILDWFDPAVEAYRLAPAYDFAAPPPPGEALYDGWGWALTSERWRALARAALAGSGVETVAR
jgi:N-acetylglucosamine malate deacetylase 2